MTGRRSAIRNEISDSCRMSFSVSLAIASRIRRVPGQRMLTASFAVSGNPAAGGPSAICELRRLRGGCRRRSRRAEVRRAGEARGRSPTSARRRRGPSRSGRSCPSLPPRLSIMCTSVASRVQGDDRAAVLELAVVAEDDVEQRLGVGSAGSPGSPRSRGARGSSRAGSRPGACRRRSGRSRRRPSRRPRSCRCRAAARR